MEKTRCNWVSNDELYIKYHDEEWGKPVYDDKVLFEFLVLESFQAGLSWITILKKRENFRKAFDNFNDKKIAKYDDAKIEELLQNEGIIRHRGKIEATINNARVFQEIQKEFGSFSDYLWKYVNGKQIDNKLKSIKDVVAKTEISDALAKDLKKRGFKFMGSTTVYAFMQAIGMVNDHITSCFCYKKV
ncbi:DNA-3-methyladenine glycosylase I [Paenimyroides ummariense]|uniref:DNA-3-methyladenine glycosylase I n=1 Tax=Paenimyroides ummariense TaxID=913024 RepID=A0A1I5CBJ2_9FLAO|nr:DNA-3-methyladenine glycosylase I [Paenimyroides ummariense]SFN84359.1 DNA-3-methyladenine glycosylase I [Paenimyroides ummariense]